jgi:F-type H+-transporting ATPase subunit b
MPQFEISTYISQIFWLVTTFFCFWMIMDRFIVPKIRESVEERKRKYDEIILKAEKFNQKAKASLEMYENKISAAKEDMDKTIKKHEEELKKIIEEQEIDIETKLKRKIQESEKMLSQERKETIDKIDELSEQTALAIVQKLNLNHITIDDIKNVS